MGYVPILFDFDCPTDRSFTETIVILAGMSRFVIVDITNPSSSPLELQATVPTFNIPFVPIIQKGEQPFSMFKDLQVSFGGSGNRMLDLLTYSSADVLAKVLQKAIVEPALERSQHLSEEKKANLLSRDAEDYL